MLFVDGIRKVGWQSLLGAEAEAEVSDFRVVPDTEHQRRGEL